MRECSKEKRQTDGESNYYRVDREIEERKGKERKIKAQKEALECWSKIGGYGNREKLRYCLLSTIQLRYTKDHRACKWNIYQHHVS